MASGGACDACLTLAPVTPQSQYKNKGDYTDVEGFKTYVVGEANADVGILLVYDVFGFSPQILQGADLLAYPSGSKKNYKVFMPDLLHGQLADPSWFNGTEEGKAKVGKYFGEGGPANVKQNITNLHNVMEKIKSQNSGLKQFAAVGYCWGAKIVTLSAGEGSNYHAAAMAHPSLLDAEDAKSVTIPMLILPSQGEDQKLMESFYANLKGPKHMETYSEMPHGWMAARGDLDNDPGKSEFIRGYTQVANFFESHFTASGPQL